MLLSSVRGWHLCLNQSGTWLGWCTFGVELSYTDPEERALLGAPSFRLRRRCQPHQLTLLCFASLCEGKSHTQGVFSVQSGSAELAAPCRRLHQLFVPSPSQLRKKPNCLLVSSGPHELLPPEDPCQHATCPHHVAPPVELALHPECATLSRSQSHKENDRFLPKADRGKVSQVVR